MRIVFFAAFMALAPDALADHCGPSNAVAIIQGIGASVQLSVSSTQISIAAQRQSRGEPACASDRDCASEYQCSANACVQRTATAPANQRQQVVEIVLRQRAVELREELALGRGPVIRDLAAARGVPPALFKEHRKELVAIIGDGKDPAWSGRFLQRLDALKGA